MILDVTMGLMGLTQPLKLKTVSITSVDFVETKVVTQTDFNGAVHPAQKAKQNPATIDWSKKYIKCFSTTPMVIGQFIEYKNQDYKIVESGDYSEYGYFSVIAEETSLPELEDV
jgi:hypothetical protein